MICPKCNKSIPCDSEFCPLCGEKITASESQNISPINDSDNKNNIRSTKKGSKLYIVIILLSVLLFVSIALNVYLFTNNSNQRSEQTQNTQSEIIVSQEENSITTNHTHKYIKISQIDSTCESDGKKEYECETCGHKYTETIKKAHSYSAATCTSPKKCTICNKTDGEPLGHIGGTRCSVCGKKLFENLHFSGNGRKVIKNINLPKGTYVITAKSNGTHNFIAWFHKSISDNYGNLMANSIGKSEEIYTVTGPCKDAYIEITESDGSWTIDIELYE